MYMKDVVLLNDFECDFDGDFECDFDVDVECDFDDLDAYFECTSF